MTVRVKDSIGNDIFKNPLHSDGKGHVPPIFLRPETYNFSVDNFVGNAKDEGAITLDFTEKANSNPIIRLDWDERLFRKYGGYIQLPEGRGQEGSLYLLTSSTTAYQNPSERSRKVAVLKKGDRFKISLDPDDTKKLPKGWWHASIQDSNHIDLRSSSMREPVSNSNPNS